MSELKQKTVNGVIWGAVERFSVQSVQFFIMIVMARLLTPSDYGLIGMLTIFLAVAQSLIDSGFSQALIRKQNCTEIDISTVFYFNICASISLYFVLYTLAPYIADFYNVPELCNLMRVICFSVVINSLSVVQRAIYTINIDFKSQAKASFSAALLSGIIGVVMAYKGFGVWSLVTQQLLNLSVNTALLWIMSKWRPQLIYSWQSFKELFGFGSKLMISGLIDCIYKNIYPIVIGKLFSASDLGYYTRAQQFAQLPSSNVTSIIQRVTYPILCKLQDDDERLSTNYRRLIKLSAFIIFPLMIMLSALAHPLVILLIKEKWAFCSVLLSIICFSMMWYPIHAINLNLLQVKGRSDLFLRLEIIKKCIGISILCITIPLGLVAMCFGQIISSLLALGVNTYYTGKLIKVGFFVQMKDLTPIILLCIVMGTSVYFLIALISNYYIQLIIGSVVGIIIYLFGSIFFDFPELKELLNIIQKK